MARTPFKLRSGNAPLKQTVENKKKTVGGEINRFFSDLGSRLQKSASKAGDFKAKRKQVVADKAKASSDGLTNFQRRQADKKAQRKSGGKSKYQRDVEARKARKKIKPGEFTKQRQLEGDLVVNQKLMNKDVKTPIVPSAPKAPKAEKIDYSSMSVNDLVKLRSKGNKDVQKTINAKLKANPNKWD